MDDRPDRWCILRCSPGRTLLLATALTEAGFVAWTPGQTRWQRLPRSKKRKEVSTPLAPSIVFAAYDRLPELLALSRAPGQTYQVWDAELCRMVTKGVPFFRLFRHFDGYPAVADRELDPLRLAEQSGRPRDKVRALAEGELVKHPGAGFDGMTGAVVRMKGRYALVCFPGLAIPVEIEPRFLIAC